MYKTGAQLQAFLAGRTADPLRLCDECARGGFIATLSASELPEGAELMPCVVPGCTGTWVFFPGQRLAGEVDADGLPLDRMCLEHRRERGDAGESVEAEAEAEAETKDEGLREEDLDTGEEAQAAEAEQDAAEQDAAEASAAGEIDEG